jgi:hypothetical protein
VKNKRETQIPQLKWVKACAGAVLEETDIMCQWIPVFPVWGEELDIQGKVIRKGIIRDAKDPAQMYNFWMTSATEEVSLRPKTPFIGAEGQFEGHEKKWGQANKRSFAYLEYKPVTDRRRAGPAAEPFPDGRRPGGHAADGAARRRQHQGGHRPVRLEPRRARQRDQRRAGAQQQRQGDVANFHYIDNLHRSIRHCGRCLVDMIPHYYDAARVVEIMRENGEIESMPINQPATNEAGQPVDKDGQPVVNPLQQVQHVLNDVTIGRYGVTFDAGPGFATQREETKASIIELGGKWPKLLDVAGDVVVENMDWMGADKIARRLKASMPQELTAGDEGEDGKPSGPPPLPPEIEQHIQQADQFIDQLQQQLAEAQAGHQAALDKAKLEAASREEVARINSQGKADAEEIKGMIALLLQHMQPPPALAAAATQTEDSRPAASQAAEPAQTTAQPE